MNILNIMVARKHDALGSAQLEDLCLALQSAELQYARRNPFAPDVRHKLHGQYRGIASVLVLEYTPF